jgi:hypothetical protein
MTRAKWTGMSARSAVAYVGALIATDIHHANYTASIDARCRLQIRS